MKKFIAVLLSTCLLAADVVSVEAGIFRRHRPDCTSGCGDSGCATGGCTSPVGQGCQPACQQPCQTMQTVQRTIMVPTWELQTQTVPCTVLRPETREETYTVMKQVPVQQQIEREVCVMVPEQRTRTVNYTECRVTMETEQRECTVQVPYQEVRTAVRNVRTMVPEQRTRTVNYTAYETQMEQQERSYTVNVPYQETRTAMREVCRIVPVTQTRIVCEDHGSWQMQPCAPNGTPTIAPNADPISAQAEPAPRGRFTQIALRRRARGAADACGGCAQPSGCSTPCAPAPCAVAARPVWVPNIVQREVPYTVYRRETEQVPYEYTVNLCRPETRTQVVQVPRRIAVPKTREVTYVEMVPKVEQVPYEYTVNLTRPETKSYTVQVPRREMIPQTREVSYTVRVPKRELRTETVTVMQAQPETRTRSFTVQVPVVEQKEVQVRVCKMVPKTIECQIAVAANCGDCR